MQTDKYFWLINAGTFRDNLCLKINNYYTIKAIIIISDNCNNNSELKGKYITYNKKGNIHN